jgi:hypothetical protein
MSFYYGANNFLAVTMYFPDMMSLFRFLWLQILYLFWSLYLGVLIITFPLSVFSGFAVDTIAMGTFYTNVKVNSTVSTYEKHPVKQRHINRGTAHYLNIRWVTKMEVSFPSVSWNA